MDVEILEEESKRKSDNSPRFSKFPRSTQSLTGLLDWAIISGRWQAPAAVLPMAQRQLTEGPRTKGTATRGPEGPESGKNMRARGPEGPEDELS